ncbi:hypothetical protein ABNF97_06120 [Plantactinospora sp. B6F1]|uniref:hypothetical protein n=1 Tax=Plantactinospora sp. B6F1 TaxID=3158971 RepID=UPI0032D988AE
MRRLLRRTTPKRHRRDWRRLWRYCRCGLRWRCPDRLAAAPPTPVPPPPPAARPARATNQRRGWDSATGNRVVRASRPVGARVGRTGVTRLPSAR